MVRIPIISAILSAIAWLRNKLKREPNKIVRFRDDSINKEVAQIIINAPVTNSPIVVVQDGKTAFAGSEANILTFA